MRSSRLLHGYQILVVEDSPDVRRLLIAILTNAGAKVTVATNGEEAVHRVFPAERTPGPAECGEAVLFDVILMDLQMPVMDGCESTRRLRAGGYRRPIIALTACAMKEKQQECLQAGCDAFLSKPIKREELVACVIRSAAAWRNPPAATGTELQPPPAASRGTVVG